MEAGLSRRLVVGWAGAFIVTALLGAPAAAAQAPAPFSFVETTPLTASCTDLRAGVEAVVQNETARARELTVSLGRITDSAGEKVPSAEVCGGLTVAITEAGPKANLTETTTTAPVEGGGTAVVTLRGATEPTGDAAFATTIVLHADGGPVSRRTVNVSRQPTAVAAAVPLIASREVAHQRFNLADEWTLWVPVDLPPGIKPAFEPGATAGVLSGEHGNAPVTYGSQAPQPLNDSTELVALHIDAVRPGTYTGSVDLTNDPETGKVTVTLTAKHWWLLAVAAIVLGIFIALLVQWLSGYRTTKARLLKRVTDTCTTRKNARDRLQTPADGATWRMYDLNDKDFKDARDELTQEINDRTTNKWVPIDQKIVDDIGAKIDALNTKIGALDTLRKVAPLLCTAISDLAKHRPPNAKLPPLQSPDPAKPRLVSGAEELLRGKKLGADELVERVAELIAMTAAMRALREYDEALAHYWGLAGTLETDLTDPEQRKLAAAIKLQLEGLRHGLWDAATAKVVDERAKVFEAIRQKIDELWPSLPEPPSTLHVRTRPVLPFELLEAFGLDALTRRAPVQLLARYARPLSREMETLADLDWDLAKLSAGGAPALIERDPPPPANGAPPLPTPPGPPTPPPPMTKSEADDLISSARTTQRVVAVVSLVVATVTAMSALYVGKAWGTRWDYLYAVVWGSLTQAVVTAIAAAIGGLGAFAAVKQGIGAPRL